MRLGTCRTGRRGWLTAALGVLLALPFVFGLGRPPAPAHADALVELSPGGSLSSPRRIINAGQVTGTASTAGDDSHAFFYDSEEGAGNAFPAPSHPAGFRHPPQPLLGRISTPRPVAAAATHRSWMKQTLQSCYESAVTQLQVR
jgi:hypothetical protein